MIAILFSASPDLVAMDDAINHLATHSELYWEVGYPVTKSNFQFPLLGFIYINGEGVNYKIVITDIIPFSSEHYENTSLAEKVKPKKWQEDYTLQVKQREWKTVYVISSIEQCSYEVSNFFKIDGQKVNGLIRSYIRVFAPDENMNEIKSTIQKNNFKIPSAITIKDKTSINERNLEDLIISQLENIESGLQLVSRQLSTPAGRLDILCKDKENNYVVIELKKTKGTDQVVGQIMRYIGWVKKEYNTDKFRGIIIVSKKDLALEYAIAAVSYITVKEFKVSIE